ncbi:hypothetical protein WA158_005088 [Blastocystis sp. Blastoise]
MSTNQSQQMKNVIIMPRWQEFVRGGSCAILNVFITFPITKLMFRQQLNGSNCRVALQEMYREGIRSLYRGVAPPLFQKTISTSLMFGVYDYYIQLFGYYFRNTRLCNYKDCTKCRKSPPFVLRIIASTCSGLTEAILTPFERAQTLLQIPKYNQKYPNFIYVYKDLHLNECYTGFRAVALRNMFGSGLFLALREPFTRALRKSQNYYICCLTDFLSGAVLGAVISTCTFPFNVAKVYLQKDLHIETKSIFKAWKSVVQERGSILGLYKGAGVNFFRGLLSWGIINSLYEAFSLADMNFQVGSVFRLGKKIGSGAFGDIYNGVNTDTNEEVAIKIEQKKNPNPQLLFESKLYSVFQGGIGIPRMYWYGTEGAYNVLVMELLGPNLEDMYNYCNRKFSLKTILMLAQEMILRLEFVHSRNFIHRDIKPENFLLGSKTHPNVVYIIDFGLSKKYRNPLTKSHIKFVENKSLTGTPRYASLNNHLGMEQSRRDDLEALGFVLMYFLRGKLPWQGLNAANKKQKYERITRTKQSITFEELCNGYPSEFCTYLTYCRGLKFDETPNYEYLRGLFSTCMIKNNFKDDGIYDWMDVTVPHDGSVLPAHMKDIHGNLIPEYMKPAPVEYRKSLLLPAHSSYASPSTTHQSPSYSLSRHHGMSGTPPPPPPPPTSTPPPHVSYIDRNLYAQRPTYQQTSPMNNLNNNSMMRRANSEIKPPTNYRVVPSAASNNTPVGYPQMTNNAVSNTYLARANPSMSPTNRANISSMNNSMNNLYMQQQQQQQQQVMSNYNGLSVPQVSRTYNAVEERAKPTPLYSGNTATSGFKNLFKPHQNKVATNPNNGMMNSQGNMPTTMGSEGQINGVVTYNTEEEAQKPHRRFLNPFNMRK